MNNHTISDHQPPSLAAATVQEIQLELIRRAWPGGVNGERLVTSLLAHRNLWDAVMMDRFCFSNPGKLPRLGLIKLRDLPQNFWNVDTMYILTPNIASARQLAEIIEAEDWGGMVQLHDNQTEVEEALGGLGREAAVVSVWWD